MVLSRMELDLSKRETMMALAAPSRLHGAVEQAFSGERKRNLWRLDTLRGRQYLLLLSEERPDLTRAAEQFGFPDRDPAWESRDYLPFLQRIGPGTRWHFRLTANPTISRKRDGKRGKVYAHITPGHQKEWLLKKSEKRGFSLEEDSFDVVRSCWQRFSRKGERTVSILSVTYEGILTVTDPELLRASLIEGIGRGKAYGMGLMTLVRIQEQDHG